jgi:nucleoside phosphorylase
MTDYILDRITYSPTAHRRPPVVVPPWPTWIMPQPVNSFTLGPNDPLPKCPNVLVRYTSAEWESASTVLRAGKWFNYAHNFAQYEPQLTGRSPAREAKCLATVAMLDGPNGDTLLLHCQLHLATDGDSIPLVQLYKQIIAETECERIVESGTAGGIGTVAQLGDVIVAPYVRAHFTERFKSLTWANATFPTMMSAADSWADDLAALYAANAHILPEASRPARMRVQPVITVDEFSFDTSTNVFGLQQLCDPEAGAEEMDAACLGQTVNQLKLAGLPTPFWTSIRDVSDPQANMDLYPTIEDAKRAMSEIYENFGEATSANSACTAWMALHA